MTCKHALSETAHSVVVTVTAVPSCLFCERDALAAERDRLTKCLEAANANHEHFERQWYLVRDELEDLRALVNSPRTDDFFEAVRIEAAHQVERWGVEHDAGKRPEDWITLFMYLLGKAAKAHFDGNRDKLLHHVITAAAVALNWHRNATGESTRMRPGI